MSGVAGADRVKSRQDFQQFLKSYKDLVSKFPGFVSMNPSGSYNSNLEKNDFGDIDLIVHIQSDKDKAAVKKELQAFLQHQPETVIVPFSSAKHAGKRSYNAGELVSVRYHDNELGYSAQIDNIVALDQTEATFKQQFLDWPAEKQGLILGLVKIATIETNPAILFKKLGINIPTQIEKNQEYEFNLSSVELQLRLVTYDPELLAQGQYKQLDREVVWSSRNFEDIQKLLYQYDIGSDFDSLLAQSKKIIKNPRSNARMQGVFGSMITVKSGEVGTAKGAGKEAALDKIRQTFGEGRSSLFKALMEASKPSTVVFAFGRFQPPTVGHELLINTVKQTAEQLGCPYYIYVSRTVGTTPATKLKNPLNIDQKMGYLQKMFPGTNFVAAGDTTRTPIEVAKALNEKFQNLVMVAGSDRVPGFEQLLNQQNGVDYNFQSIKVVSGGERDPDADDAIGMSGTKLRQAAAADDFDTFKQGMPNTVDDATAQQLMADVKAGMTPTPKVKKAKEAFMPRSYFAGTEPPWNYKLGSDAQLKGNMKRPAKAGDLVGGGAEESLREDLDTKKSWADYGMPDKEPPKEKVFHGWTEYDLAQKEKEKQQTAKKVDKTVKEKMMPASMFAGSGKNKLGVAEKQVDEKWSEKYKRSIDCSHPKGFSQRAHCAGKKKHNEDMAEDDSSVITHMAKGLENPPKVMQHRAKRDQERDQQWIYTQVANRDKSSKDEWGNRKDENADQGPTPPGYKPGIGGQTYVSRPQAPMGPMEAVKTAASKLQSALQREKERRQSRERLGQELLNPKKPEPKQVPVSEDVEKIMSALIEKIIVNEAIQNKHR